MKKPNEEIVSNRYKRFFQRISYFRYLVMGAVGLLTVTFLMQLTWNFILPVLFGLPPITYWQALGLIVLLRLTAGVLGFTRRPPKRAGFMRPRPGYTNHTFLACDSHRVI